MGRHGHNGVPALALGQKGATFLLLFLFAAAVTSRRGERETSLGQGHGERAGGCAGDWRAVGWSQHQGGPSTSPCDAAALDGCMQGAGWLGAGSRPWGCCQGQGHDATGAPELPPRHALLSTKTTAHAWCHPWASCQQCPPGTQNPVSARVHCYCLPCLVPSCFWHRHHHGLGGQWGCCSRCRQRLPKRQLGEN